MENQASTRTTIIVFIVVILVIIGSGALLLSSRPEPVQITINPPVPTSTPLPTATPAPILVYVTGEVNQPETTVELPNNSRVMDAISASGGFTDNADLERVNIAGILRDGDQVHVPALIEETAQSEPALPTPSGGTVVHINTATVEELQALPGIGPSIAQRIIDYRDANGPFTRLEDLDNVAGIGSTTLETLSEFLAFD